MAPRLVPLLLIFALVSCGERENPISHAKPETKATSEAGTSPTPGGAQEGAEAEPATPEPPKVDVQIIPDVDPDTVDLPKILANWGRWHFLDGEGTSVEMLPGQYEHAEDFELFQDSKKVVFVRAASDAREAAASATGGQFPRELVVADRDGRHELEPLDRSDRPIHFAISPDATRVVYEKWNLDNFDLWVTRLDGSEKPQQLTKSEFDEVAPMWFQGGKRVAFVRRTHKHTRKQTWDLDDPRQARGLSLHSVLDDGTALEELSARSAREYQFLLAYGQRCHVETWQALNALDRWQSEQHFNRNRSKGSDIECASTFNLACEPLDGLNATEESTYFLHASPGWAPDGSMRFYFVARNEDADVSCFMEGRWNEETKKFSLRRLWRVTSNKPFVWKWADQRRWRCLRESTTVSSIEMPARYHAYVRTTKGLIIVEAPPKHDITPQGTPEELAQMSSCVKEFFELASTGAFDGATITTGGTKAMTDHDPPFAAFVADRAQTVPTKLPLVLPEVPEAAMLNLTRVRFECYVCFDPNDTTRFTFGPFGGELRTYMRWPVTPKRRWFSAARAYQFNAMKLTTGDVIDRIDIVPTDQ